MAVIGLILITITGSFAYLRGWLTPHALTPTKFVNAFETLAGGVHPGFRRNHAKGVCVVGYFESNGQGTSLSKAAVFEPARVPVVGRFSLGGGAPMGADSSDNARGLGLQFTAPNGEIWRTAMINLPVFPVNGPQAFYDFLFASHPDPATGKPDPQKMKAFLEKNPETAAALKIITSQQPSSDFRNATFHSIDAFWFTNPAGTRTPIRWILTPDESNNVPSAATSPATASPATTQRSKDYLFDRLIEDIHRAPLKWHLMLIVGQSGDSITDPTLPWPADRQEVDAGTITIEQVQSDDESPTRDLNFDPLVLPDGITPSDDPLLSARSGVYSQSVTRRAGETKTPSEFPPAAVQNPTGGGR